MHTPVAASFMMFIPFRSRRAFGALLLALVPAAGAYAQQDPTPAGAPAAAQAGATPRVYTLHDLIVDAFNANLELQAKRIDPKLEVQHVIAAQAAFDPTIALGSSYQYQQNMQNSLELQNAQFYTFWSRVQHNEAALTGKFATGTESQLSTSADQTQSTLTWQSPNISLSGSSIQRHNIEYSTVTALTLTQHVLKDGGTDATLAEVRMSQSALSKTRFEFRDTVLKVLSDLMDAYDEMVFGQENLKVKAEAVALADNLVKENTRRYDEGKMSPLDVTQARERLSEAREELLLARNFLGQRRNKLRELTRESFPLDEDEWSVDGSFLLTRPPELHRDRLLVEMLQNNPGYLANLELAHQEDIRVAYAKNQDHPTVDLKGSFSFNGLGGNWAQGYRYNKEDSGNALLPTVSATGPNWSAGVVVQVPIGMRADRARLAESRARKAQALLNIKRSENELLGAFATVYSDINTAVERMGLVHDSVVLAQDALTSEQKRLNSGVGTSYNVAAAQKDLSLARSRELAALVDLNKALTQLYALSGTLPERMNVRVEGD